PRSAVFGLGASCVLKSYFAALQTSLCFVFVGRGLNMRVRFSFAAMVLCAALSGSVFGQSERGTISGTVHDSSGAVIPAARVTATNIGTNSAINVASNETGDYTIPSLPVGLYNVLVEKEGFRPAQITGLTLNAAANVRADVTLQVGTEKQLVEVQATVVQLHTEDAKTSATVTNRMVDQLPLVVGGALRSPVDLPARPLEPKNVSAADECHQARSNDFHGSAYQFLRNDGFDANYFFSNKKGIPRPIYKQNDFGASLGGPVWIPKVYDGRNKTFFFFAYEGFRNRQGATAFTTTVPTPEMYNGDFSNWVDKNGKQIPIYDPTTQVTNADGTVTRKPFPNNQIPKALFDPLAVKALGVFQASGVLTPNTGAAPGTVGYVTNNYVVTKGSNVSPINKWSIKGDHSFSEKDRISGYYGYDREAIV